MPKPHWLLIPLRWLAHLGTWLLAVLVAFEEWGWEPLQRVLARRGVITPTGTTARSGRSGGRPAALYRFTDSTYRVTDEFAALRPPS